MGFVAHLWRFKDDGSASLGIFNILELCPRPGLRPREMHFACLEPPWRDNLAKKSCVPIGTYCLVRRFSNRFETETFEVSDLAQQNKLGHRSNIILHWGNTTKDTEGCLLLGMGLTCMPPFVGDSRAAFQEFMTFVGDTKEIPFGISNVR